MDIEKFWQEKEKENNSKLIKRSVAGYKHGYPGLSKPVKGGLFYLMENGFYFENFKSSNLMENYIFREEFKKISIFIPLDKIISVYDRFGNKKHRKETFIDKLKSVFFKKPGDLNIEYKNEENENIIVTFSTVIDPLIFCEEYYKLV